VEGFHIAVVTLLGNGHVYPVLPLCSELVKRGHDVTYVTSSHYSSQIADVGARPVIFGYRPPSAELKNQVRKTIGLKCDDVRLWPVLRSYQKHQFSIAEHLLSEVKSFYEANPPDLILYDAYAIGGRLLAHRLNCKAVRISPHFAQYKRYFIRQNGVFEDPPGAEGYRDDLDSFLLSHGIRTANNLWYVERLNIHFIPREFQYCKSYFDDRFCFVGALLDRPFTPAWKNTSAGRPIVLISDLSGLLDTNINSASYYRLLIESLSDGELHCVLSIGDSFDPSLLGQLPDHFQINRSASHLEILPHATISVCHGGMLSTLEALYNGVPVLSIPSDTGTEEVSYRNVELGGGRKLARDTLTADVIRKTINEMLNDASLRCRVTEMQHMFKRSGGAQLAADQIESSVRQG